MGADWAQRVQGWRDYQGAGRSAQTGGAAVHCCTPNERRTATLWDCWHGGEFSEDPDAFFASHLLHMAQQLSLDTRQFAAINPLAHGPVQLALVLGLLRGLRWPYPMAALPLTVIDITVLGLILREWRHVPAR